MAVYRPKYKDPKTGETRHSNIWWYSFRFADKRIRESAKTTLKTLAKKAEENRRRELEKGFNGIADNREGHIRTINELAAEYLEDYRLRHKSYTFAEYALGNVTRHVGDRMSVEVTVKTVREYQTARLKEKSAKTGEPTAPKTINEEVGFLLRLLGARGDVIRAEMRRKKELKLAVQNNVGRAYTAEEEAALLERAKDSNRRSKAIYPQLLLGLSGLRDGEVLGLQWGRVYLDERYLVVGHSKTEAGEGRTVPLNSTVLAALVEYSKWYTERFGTIQPGWYVFPYGKPRPHDPTRPQVTMKTAWYNTRDKAGVTGRFHDTRHTAVTNLSEAGASHETIKSIVGHADWRMVERYSHIRMQAKRAAMEAAGPGRKSAFADPTPQIAENALDEPILEIAVKESAKVERVN